MKAVLEQFRNLNTRDPGSWPALPKLALLSLLFIFVLVVAYFVDWQGQLEELEAGRSQEAKLKQEYADKKRQAVNLDVLRVQLRDIETSFGALLKQLPNKSQMEALLVEINQAGLGRGLQFELFRPAPAESVKEFYAELADHHQSDWKFPRHGRFRERCRPAPAHRDFERHAARRR